MAKRSWHMCSACGEKIHRWNTATMCIPCQRRQARQARRKVRKEERDAVSA